jgi:hypothetical protein
MISEATVQKFRDEYAAATTEYERACIEQSVGLAIVRADGKGVHKKGAGRVVGKMLGLSTHVTACHTFLINVGDLAEPLWSLLDADMTLSTATTLVRRARKIKLKGETTQAALMRALAEYVQLPHVKHLPGGKIIRQTGPVTKPITRNTEHESEPPGAVARSGNGADERKFWAQVRGMLLGYVQSHMVGFSEENIEIEVRRMDIELKVAFEQFSHRLRGRTNQEPLSTVISRRRLSEACQVLRIDPPKSVTAVEPAFFVKAQRQFKLLAKEYHPDTHGTDATRPMFETVMSAWRTIEQFRDSL